jgi:transcriptional regulator GlxA family with amidase domain
LLRAQALLEQTALSITDVAVACGFTSPAHFATVYRRAFGLPPSAARRASSKDRL